jgi:hypothetical protein
VTRYRSIDMWRRILKRTFFAVGALLLVLSAVALATAAIALSERIRFGPGLMFADVEILVMLAIVLGLPGGILVWLGKRFFRNGRSQEAI